MTNHSRRIFVKYSAILSSMIVATPLDAITALGRIEFDDLLTSRALAATHPFFAQVKNRPEVIAHQGGRGQWPGENLYAFEQATKIEVDILEFDIRSTKDDQLVLMHNETVDSTTNGKGRIRQFTLKDLKKLDAGYRWTGTAPGLFPTEEKTLPYQHSKKYSKNFQTSA